MVGLFVSVHLRRLHPVGSARDPKTHDLNKRNIERAALRARSELAERRPLLSACKPAGRIAVSIMFGLTLATICGTLGLDVFQNVTLLASLVFAALGLMRACTCFFPAQPLQTYDGTKLLDIMPTWTILIALYREADSVSSLLTALSKLEWAKDRLDIIFACEHDDAQTIDILKQHQKTSGFRIIRIPAGGPRTKPNALQTALPFVHGRFITIYDAEDRPDPQQLRAAFEAFLKGPPNLAVVQAPLVTWNHAESWIARQFSLDYATWFRVILPAFAHLSGLIPLGGTSNHFRTDVLRKVGGWDPYNVTEDADLGVRLGRCGYKAALIAPPTFEEAPPRVSAWVKQRGRWIQGHIQTFALHLRAPATLWRDIGWRGLLAFFLGLGIGPMSALLVLPFMFSCLVAVSAGRGEGMWLPLGLGLLGHLGTSIVAAKRDGRWALLTCILTLPAYHCLQSIAACRAIWRVLFTPAIWDKTDHGSAARVPKKKGNATWTLQRHWPFWASAPCCLPSRLGVPLVRHNLVKSA
jgi:glycosyltransferase XagB